ncbi:MAG: hypothetical protein A2509_12485 [Candidatus Edwardsbacteria bacterium RIFOXYD12_FULL_50_11]|jgi:hypothetical protein|uniref:Uncharacterized protein n=1 Tax=Candidatus Edwardsbacteria bacterium GWF2_54_11 TaxID=1817851 RepID=A0A1F5RIT0_9BACT|nr:MAG: hypothetical protein A2502_04775 [Candidatus Edwardsbacteria bacterium RifOxyC12_full_54_24]OGF08706.1 MAG: hypothetical protein A2273_07155 [Candidatus Edwardsbacteria bacterium RifOxyA12_full_54_48]OGF12299.1 MAG: hypothetical protein A3K15_00330 [Candidatus Edwardsbacteria bacterium GWE2_54_12]OGF14356.1 MAG: hypothetical protein A2024_10245 [Candidatus Edwardsbacteria bacterium GWF2_54_11]OGF15794.1 MAG: hypothetical protein A2509_12485 [Candidatus Edwardsbacteria bacterium RIFOXYD1
MKRQIPLIIVLTLGIFFFFQFFIPSQISTNIYQTTLQWTLVISAFAIVLAVGSLFNHHLLKVRRRKPHWWNSIVTLMALVVMALLGIFGRVKGLESLGELYHTLFLYVQAPMDSAMFAILAFYMASAAYRAFRARSQEAALLLISGFIVMLGVIPFGSMIWSKIPDIAEWIMMVPNMAAKRGILFGIGLGMTATSLKIILGIERSWLGGGGK